MFALGFTVGFVIGVLLMMFAWVDDVDEDGTAY